MRELPLSKDNEAFYQEMSYGGSQEPYPDTKNKFYFNLCQLLFMEEASRINFQGFSQQDNGSKSGIDLCVFNIRDIPVIHISNMSQGANA